MTDVIAAHAPGKLFVLGEYAVLDGCPAVVAAVNRFVTARVQAGTAGADVRIEAGAHGSVRFAAGKPPAEEGPLRFVLAAWRSVVERWPGLARRDVLIEVTSTLDDPVAGKTGLGSSAATVVATVAALQALSDSSPDTTGGRIALLETALAAHRRAQGGTGSGGDVVASVFGGTTLFEPRGEGLPIVTPLPWPTGTELLAGWSGAPASTTGLVERYRTASPPDAAARAGFFERTRAAVADFVAALRGGRVALDALNAGGDALDRLGAELHLPVVTPALRSLVRAARGCGAAAKASGAGGGDCAIAVATDAHMAAAVCRAWEAAGFAVLDVALSREGVTIARC
ncbi:hypothetical protein L6Q96_12410 [Candidatus Binatia bacterium]|nr:hypothetical protein [Candidatus Binatia bacterium]